MALIIATAAHAAVGNTFSIGTLSYKVISENTSTGKGSVSVKIKSSSTSGTVEIPESVQRNDITYSVTAIQSNGFTYSNITGIVIPATVSSIPDYSINAATLQNIEVDGNNSHFVSVDDVLYDKDMTHLICYPAAKADEVFHTPSSLTVVNAGACMNAVMKEVWLNEGLTRIENEAFRSTKNLTYIDIPTTLEFLGGYPFQSSNRANLNVNIHDLAKFCQVTMNGAQSYIWEYGVPSQNLLIDGQLVKDLVIPAEITTVRYHVFMNCQLNSVTFMGDMENIGNSAFSGCFLHGIRFNGTCQNIEYDAFKNNRLTSDLHIPVGLRQIPSNAFSYNASHYFTQATNDVRVNDAGDDLTINGQEVLRINVYIPDGVEAINHYAFEKLPINELHIQGTSLKTVQDAFGTHAVCGKCKALYIDELDYWLNVDFVLENNGHFYTNQPQFLSPGCPFFANRNFPMGGHENNGVDWRYELGFQKKYSLGVNQYDIPIPRIVNFSDLYIDGRLVTDLVIPEGTKVIKRGAFAGCKSIRNVTLPNSLDTIHEYAFYQCKNIRVIKIPNSVRHVGISAFDECQAMKHVTMPSWATSIGPNVVKNFNTDVLTEFTVPAYVTSFHGVKDIYYTPFTDMSVYFMGDSIPNHYEDPLRWADYRTYEYDEDGVRHAAYTSKHVVWSDTTEIGCYSTSGYSNAPVKLLKTQYANINSNYPHYNLQKLYVKKSVYFDKYPDGKWRGYDVGYQVPVTMKSASGTPIEYKTLCRDFDVDLTHTNDDLPEGVQPLRAYVVEDVDGDLRMVFLREIKYVPSRLKANLVDEDGNRYQGVDEYVGVVLRGTPGHTYHYEIGEHDYTQGAEGQWLMADAMAYSGTSFEANLMAGDANDEFYVHKTVMDEDGNEIVNYGLNSNRFKVYNKDGWLMYNKAYLQLPKSVSDAIELNKGSENFANLTFVFENADGSTDRVSAIEFNKNAEAGIFYNPMGQRVKADAKGIVISNGKKVFNK